MSKGSALVTTFLVIALATTLVLPNRPTPTVVKGFFDAVTNTVRVTIGLV